MIQRYDTQPSGELVALIESLLNESIDPEGFARLEEILSEDAEARRVYRRYMNLHASLPLALQDASLPRLLDLLGRSSGVAIDGLADDADEAAVVEALAELARLHDEGRTAPIRLNARRASGDKQTTSTHHRTRTLARLIIAGGFAAFVVLGVAVGLIALSMTSGTPTPVAQQPVPPRQVATLTGTSDAAWGSGADLTQPAEGDRLYPGQRLELVSGLAEVTTKHGAVLTLEAPATIELIDNPNGLRLITGKLVGVVEDDAAQGLIVHSPYMDVTDLGTRFGIDASEPNATEVHVYEGSVEASSPAVEGAEPNRMLLIAGYAARAQAGSSDLEEVPCDLQGERFASIDSPWADFLLATGWGLKSGEIDPNWRIVAVDGRALSEAADLIVHGKPVWGLEQKQIPSGRMGERWLANMQAFAEGTIVPGGHAYTCQATLDLPADIDLEQVDLVLGITGDRAVLGVRVNGMSFDIPADVRDKQTFFAPYFEHVIDSAVKPGVNTIEFDAYDTDRLTTVRAGVEIRRPRP